MTNNPYALEIGRTYLYVGDFQLKYSDIVGDDMIMTLKTMKRVEISDREPCRDCSFTFRSAGGGMATIYDKNINQERQTIRLDTTPSGDSILVPLDYHGIDMAKKVVRAIAYKSSKLSRTESVREHIYSNTKKYMDIIKKEENEHTKQNQSVQKV